MTKNIKEIGKELLGKSLNSFHKKTGLTQLEKNNEMQDGILNGILSQVDDAYIEKTEQSNVLHLDGSGDGVVVLDGIEGNTMVNLASLRRMTRFASTGNMVCDYDGIYYKGSFYNTYYVSSIAQQPLSTLGMQQGKTYTLIQYQKLDKSIYNDDTTTPRQSGFIFYDKSSGTSVHLGKDALSEMINVGETKITKTKFTVDSRATHFDLRLFTASKSLASKEVSFSYWFILLEGDYTNKEVNFFEGLQSSFEEKINDEGKYEIEILNNNKNLFDLNKLKDANNWNVIKEQPYHYIPIRLKPNTTYKIHCKQINSSSDNGTFFGIFDEPAYYSAKRETLIWASSKNKNITFTTDDRTIYYWNVYFNVGFSQSKITELFEQLLINVQMEENTKNTNYIPHKQNKIKLLINEPLRAISNNIKDRLCVKDGKLVVERKCGQATFDGTIGVNSGEYKPVYGIQTIIVYGHPKVDNKKTNSQKTINSTLPCITSESYGFRKQPNFSGYVDKSAKFVGAIPNTTGVAFNHTELNQYFVDNPMEVVYELENPTYEEVLNEYGEPILLEGYENGTLYIDSTIVPTTTVRYTPKMESFNALKEVGNNNIMLTNDINNTIVPYMMEVDLMIMEKEVALMSQKNIRKIGAEDMTCMQKRTQQMLERLIKGKSLAEQECKTRVTVYLNAGKITDEQAKELNFLIDEIYT